MTDPTDDELQQIGNYKYHSARVVALSSGRVAMIGHHSNAHGLPVVDIFDNFHDLHVYLSFFQRVPWTIRYEVETKPQRQLSLEDLGMVKPLRRRSLNGTI